MQKNTLDKGTSAGLRPGESAIKRHKEKQAEANEEGQDTEESEEEGEIGDSQTLVRISTRGCKSAREKRE